MGSKINSAGSTKDPSLIVVNEAEPNLICADENVGSADAREAAIPAVKKCRRVFFIERLPNYLIRICRWDDVVASHM
jgi:hypothetical protein